MDVDTIRVYELAKELDIPGGEAVEKLRELGYQIPSKFSRIDEAAARALRKAVTVE